MQENGTASGSFRQVRWFHVAALAAVTVGSFILADLTARDLRAVGEQLATTSIGQTDGNDQPIYVGYFESYDGPNAHGFGFPSHLTLDPVNHRLFILSGSSDNGGRIGAWQLEPDDTVGDRSLFAVIGQPHIKGALTTTSAAVIGSYAGDRRGYLGFNATTEQLLVSDSDKNRVLLFDVAEVTTGESATDALGQLDENDDPVFTTSTVDGTLNGRVMRDPQGVAHDPVNHRLFISDTNNNRVLVFQLDTNDVPLDNLADAVLGQTDLTEENEGEEDQAGLIQPRSLAYDSAGDRLFVADSNGRVMVFDTAVVDNGEDAVNVLGFADYDFESCDGGDACNVGSPVALAYDEANFRLFVGDADNIRVMVFDVDPAVLIANDSDTDGPDAINVLGHADFSFTPCVTTGSCDFSNPAALAFDGDGPVERLFLADQFNHRVMVFDVTAIIDGEPAVNVLGKADLVPGTDCPGPDFQCDTFSPSGLAYDDAPGERLFVSQEGTHRVTVFDVSSITDGEDAVNILGQEDYDDFETGPAADRLRGPTELAYASGTDVLFVADTGDHRVLGFEVSAIADGQNASTVLGQFDENGDPSFTNGAPNNRPNARGMDSPAAAVVDTVNHRMFVADADNNRVLVFNLTAGDTFIDRVADNVLGQPGFATDTGALTSASFLSPEALAYDPTDDRLFVTDSGNNRVLVFDLSGGITDGMGAANVLGQPDFTTSDSGTTASQFDTLGGPGGLAFDDADNRLFAVDISNSRVLVFDVDTITDGEDAVNVLGQEDFLTNTEEVSQDGLNFPRDAVFSDLADLLFVVDSSSNRVMVFDVDVAVLVPGCGLACDGPDAVDLLGQLDDADQPLYTSDGGNNAPNRNGFASPTGIVVDSLNQRLWIADRARVTKRDLDPDGDLVDIFPEVVLGQATFKTITTGTTQSTLEFAPQAVVTDGTGDRLFVADRDNHRVMVFDVSTPTSSASASYVIGQPLFTTNLAAAGSDGLDSPYGLAYDVSGDRLFVADSQNNRVLVYDVSTANLNAEATGSGIAMDATGVFGQANFITNGFGTSQTELQRPTMLAFDDEGDRLFVLDANNNRVMVFDVAGVTNGEPAVAQLGQPDFDSSGPATSQSGLYVQFNTGGLAYDGDSHALFVSDSNNHRVLMYDVGVIDDGGEDAVGVIGQTTFTGSNQGPGQDQLRGPTGVGWDVERRRLYTADSVNERMMLFDMVHITTTDLPDATVGEAYSEATNADQVQGTLSFTLESGTLPPGLSVGSLTGTPTTPGTYTFTLRGTDTNGPSEFYDLQTYTMTVGSPAVGGAVLPPGSTPTPAAAGSPAPTLPGATPTRTPTGSRTPTPTTIAGVSPGPSSSGMPASPGPSTSPGPGTPTAVDRLLGDRALERVVAVTSMLIAAVSILAILLSAVLLSRNLMDLAYMGAFALQSLWVILGLKKRARIWGTVYDSSNKHPIPFAKVELTDLNGRVLETRFADRDGRYGFLTSPEQMHQQSLTVRIKPSAAGYLFPPLDAAAGTTDFLVYEHVYTGGPVTVAADSFLHYDLPMYRQPWRPTRFSEFLPLKSAGGFMSHLMNIAFWAGVVLVPLAYWQQPTTLNLIILIVFFGVHALRMLTGMYRPFGVVRNATNSTAVPYALVTLNDAQGKRRTFAVSDEQGRYFMSSDAGTYQLQTFTPANVTPQRTKTESVTTGSGWVKKKLAV